MDPTAFRFNNNVKYKPRASPGKEIYVAGTELTHSTFYVTNKNKDWFKAAFP